ncbi:MAG: tyrosine recombinase XerC [Bacteroidales bacterium]
MKLELFIEYLRTEKRYSHHTVTAYESDLRQFYHFISEEYSINSPSQITRDMIRSWVYLLLEEEHLSSRSVNRKLSALKTYYRFLRKTDQQLKSPLKQIVLPKTNKKLPQFVSKDEMMRLQDETIFKKGFEGARDRFMITLLYYTGIRLEELINIKTSDLDLSRMELKVMGKRNKERIIPLHKKVRIAALEYMNERIKRIESPEASPAPLFITIKGKPVYKRLVHRVVNEYLGKVSTLNKRSPHILRHTFATHMLNNGADLNAIKELLGHANLAATQVYTHNSIDQLKNIYKNAHPRA